MQLQTETYALRLQSYNTKIFTIHQFDYQAKYQQYKTDLFSRLLLIYYVKVVHLQCLINRLGLNTKLRKRYKTYKIQI